MELRTHISADIDLSDTIKMLNDRDRIEWMTALLETISEEGTIGVIRDLVGQTKWDDQSPNDKAHRQPPDQTHERHAA